MLAMLPMLIVIGLVAQGLSPLKIVVSLGFGAAMLLLLWVGQETSRKPVLWGGLFAILWILLLGAVVGWFFVERGEPKRLLVPLEFEQEEERADDRPEKRPAEEAIVPAVYDLAKLTPAQARRLHGRKVTFQVVVDTDGYREGQHDIYGVAGDKDVERSLYVPAGLELDDEATVEAVLVVIEHAPAVHGNTAFVGFTEYRLYFRGEGRQM
jgi:hypothetical protein